MMALEAIKTSTYQQGATQAANIGSTAGKEKIDTVIVSATNTSPDVKPVVDNENNEHSGREEYIKSEISKANNKLQHHNIRCEFDYHEETNRITIKVLDKDTNEIIHEIPPQKTLDMIQKMWELAGLLIDERR